MKKQDPSTETFVNRRLSQIKILSRLMEHELAGSKPGPTLTMDRAIAEDLLDLLEVFVEEVQAKTKARGEREREVVQAGEGKATVTRLN